MADFFVGTTVIPFISLWEVYGEWHFGLRLCNVWLCCTLLFCTVSFLTMSAIALDRYLYLIESKMDRKRRTVRRAFSLIILTWLIPAMVWIPGKPFFHQPLPLVNLSSTLQVSSSIVISLATHRSSCRKKVVIFKHEPSTFSSPRFYYSFAR